MSPIYLSSIYLWSIDLSAIYHPSIIYLPSTVCGIYLSSIYHQFIIWLSSAFKSMYICGYIQYITYRPAITCEICMILFVFVLPINLSNTVIYLIIHLSIHLSHSFPAHGEPAAPMVLSHELGHSMWSTYSLDRLASKPAGGFYLRNSHIGICQFTAIELFGFLVALFDCMNTPSKTQLEAPQRSHAREIPRNIQSCCQATHHRHF